MIKRNIQTTRSLMTSMMMNSNGTITMMTTMRKSKSITTLIKEALTLALIVEKVNKVEITKFQENITPKDLKLSTLRVHAQ